ncbi:MAG: type II toxin-antitoxin system VapC family toxin [Novosphingobium sp.]
MRLLVDTHIVLWRMTADPRLPQRAIELMDDETNSVAVSAVSVWEVAIKSALGREGSPGLPLSGADFLAELRAVGLSPLPITAEQITALDGLPLHHSDPFDRLLVAQARHEAMYLLTHDQQLAAYGDRVLVV